MKIKIEMDEQAEEEVIIRCRGMTEQIAAIQRAVRNTGMRKDIMIAVPWYSGCIRR